MRKKESEKGRKKERVSREIVRYSEETHSERERETQGDT